MSSPDWVLPAITAASGLSGGLVVALSTYAVGRRQSRDGRQAELRATAVSFLHAVSAIDHRLRLEPVPGSVGRVIDRTVEKWLPRLSYDVTRVLDPSLNAVIERFHAASSRLLLVAPEELLEPAGRLIELLETAADRDGAWWASWAETRGALVVACRRALGESIPASAR